MKRAILGTTILLVVIAACILGTSLWSPQASPDILAFSSLSKPKPNGNPTQDGKTSDGFSGSNKGDNDVNQETTTAGTVTSSTDVQNQTAITKADDAFTRKEEDDQKTEQEVLDNPDIDGKTSTVKTLVGEKSVEPNVGGSTESVQSQASEATTVEEPVGITEGSAIDSNKDMSQSSKGSLGTDHTATDTTNNGSLDTTTSHPAEKNSLVEPDEPPADSHGSQGQGQRPQVQQMPMQSEGFGQKTDMEHPPSIVSQSLVSDICPQDFQLSPNTKFHDPDTWQVIQGNVSFVFSAHLDTRPQDVALVRVFGLMLIRMLHDEHQRELFCQLWNGNRLQAVVLGSTKVLKFKYLYESFMLECEFSAGTVITATHSLSISPEECLTPTNRLQIRHNVLTSKPQLKYTVCSSDSLRANYSDYKRFVEWMELNAMMGVQKTIVYKTTVDAKMAEVMNYYVQKGSLEVIHWWPPTRSSRRLTHLSMINDCLYRNMYKTKYLALLDVDETLAPRRPGNYTWDNMLRNTGCENRSQIAALSVQFRTDWPDDYLYANEYFVSKRLGLVTLTKTKREASFMPSEDNSKNIVRPESVEYAQVHEVLLRSDVTEGPCVMTPVAAAVHHFRPFFTIGPHPSAWVVDRSLHKYGVVLVRRVTAVYHELNSLVRNGSG